MKAVVLIAAATLTAAAGSVDAQTAAPSEEDGRYELRTLENGYLRLDKQTGDMTHCVIDSHDAWKCVVVPETRERHEAKIEALESENAYLKARQQAMADRLIELEETMVGLRDSIGPEAEGADQERFMSKDQRKRLDEALDKADSMLSRFSKMMKGLRKDAEELTQKVPKILE
ncbi:MAG: hypothetical protein AAGF59_08790 [Pseudomonadota bacterium]